MREFCKYGSVRGVLSNGHPYRDRPLKALADYAQEDPSYVPTLARSSLWCCGSPLLWQQSGGLGNVVGFRLGIDAA
jgi:hypothetical protein